MPDFDIKPIVQEDIEDVSALLDGTSVETNFSEERWNEQARDFFEKSLIDERIFTVAARQKGTNVVVACGGAAIIKDDPRCYFNFQEHFGYIRLMRVHKEHRNKGIGSAMLDEIMSWFRANNIDEVQLHASQQASKLYERYGFRVSENIDMWFNSKDNK